MHGIFLFFLGDRGAVGRGSGGGVKSVTVGVQFQRHPSRRSKGGGKPESIRQNRLVSDRSPRIAHES